MKLNLDLAGIIALACIIVITLALTHIAGWW